MEQEKKLDLAILETAKIVDKYHAYGFVAFGYPDMDHISSVVAGNAKFAGYVLTNGVSCVADHLDDDDKQSFLVELLMEVLDEIAALPNEKGIEMLQGLQQYLADYQKAKEYEN
ncbi:hypothetical protein [Acidaminococcus sp.]|uniref:hypothetical protein n=1 Tax=Acidaminococcus sp. TaxID=1872103 RepID=UPI003D7C999E